MTAARRLVDWMFTHFKHFADVIVVDAGFAKAPFLHHLKARGYHFVVRLKDERMRIVQDAMGLFGMAPPDQALVEVKGIHGCRVRIWEETFDTWETMGPLRVVYVEEEMLSGPYEGRTQRILVGTDLSPQEASADMVRKMIHHRWVIENTGFHEGKGRFHLDHAYVHTATAIQAVTWFQLMAMNIYQLYFRHHLTEPRRKGYSSMEVAERMKGELLYGDKHRLRRAFSLGWSPG